MQMSVNKIAWIIGFLYIGFDTEFKMSFSGFSYTQSNGIGKRRHDMDIDVFNNVHK